MLTLSNTPTDWILVKADNNSDWFCSDFAIIQLSSVVPILEKVKETNLLNILGDISYSVELYKGYVNFYTTEDDTLDFIDNFVGDEKPTAADYLYVDYDYNRDHEDLGTLEVTLDTTSLVISKFAGISLRKNSKYTSDECTCNLPDDFIPNFE